MCAAAGCAATDVVWLESLVFTRFLFLYDFMTQNADMLLSSGPLVLLRAFTRFYISMYLSRRFVVCE
jgi:hypothetical protein